MYYLIPSFCGHQLIDNYPTWSCLTDDSNVTPFLSIIFDSPRFLAFICMLTIIIQNWKYANDSRS